MAGTADPEGLQILLESFVAIASERDVDAILEQSIDVARLLTRARYGAAAVLGDGGIATFVHKGLTKAQVRAMPHEPEGRGLLAAVLEDKAPIRRERIADDARSIGFPLNHVPMDAFLGAPIRFDEELLGGLYLTKAPGEGTFSDEHEHLVSAIARQTGVAIKTASLLSEQDRVNEELRAADQLKSHFVAIASHEMRTPLTSVLGFSSTMLQHWDVIRDEEKRRHLETIRNQADRLVRISNDLLTISRIEAGALEVRAQRFGLARKLREVLAELDAQGSPIVINCPEELELVADPDLVEQMVLNYATNALKYGARPIRIEVRESDEWIEVEVCDSGPGVPAEFVPRLFEKFARAEDARRAGGTGLGLSIVRGLAEAHGGEAWYEPGQPSGSCFGVRLPKKAAA